MKLGRCRGFWLGVSASIALQVPATQAAEADDASEPVVEYLYIDANEGGAAGGHSALRIDGVVHHYHLEDPGLLRLHRDEVASFEHLYTRLRNRTIRAARLDVDAQTRDLLRDGFERHRARQSALGARIAAARDDATLLEHLAEGDAERDWPVEGAGLFFADGARTPDSRDPSPSIAAVRERVAAELGNEALVARRDTLERRLASLSPETLAADAPAEAVWSRSLTRRHADLAVSRVALDVLQAAVAPRAAALRTDASIPLSPELRDALAHWRDTLRHHCVTAALAGRPEEGFALLLGLARLAAIDVSLASGQLRVLDAFADVHERIASGSLPDGPGMKAEASAELEAALDRFVRSPEPDEIAWARVESAVNRRTELAEALATGRDLRANSGTLSPSRAARVGGWPAPSREVALLRAEAAALRAGATEEERAFRAEYDYDLLSRNCVSEIFRVLDAALVGSPSRSLDATLHARSVAESERRLGGFLDAGAGLRFVPVVAFRAVNDTWRIRSLRTLKSWRHERLEELARSEGVAAASLRESFVPTALLYDRNPEDSLFVFFTDDATIARPFFGLGNLMLGLAGSLVGLVALPFDAGHLFDASTRGIAFSLPEIVGANIRKGSFAWAPRRGDAP